MSTTPSTQPRSTHRFLPLALAVAAVLALGPALTPGTAAFAQAYIAKPVHWHPSPLVDGQGAPLAPAISYEVWLEENSLTAYLSTTVADTSCILGLMPGVSYRVRLRAVSGTGLKSAFSAYSDPYVPSRPSPVTAQRGEGGSTAAPNPFTDRTVITFRVPATMPASDPLTLEIYDVRGHRLRSFEVTREPGVRGVTWDGRDAAGARMPSGVYLARFRCGSVTTNTKLTLVP